MIKDKSEEEIFAKEVEDSSVAVEVEVTTKTTTISLDKLKHTQEWNTGNKLGASVHIHT